MYDASERRHVKEREKATKLISRDNTEILQAIMREPNGRRWMYAQFERGNIFCSPFSTDPIQMAFNCGVQNEALQRFLEVVNLCPNEYIQMMVEANERRIREDIRRDQVHPDFERERGNLDEADRIGIRGGGDQFVEREDRED